MTKEDALLYFPLKKGEDDIDDLFEQLLFEQKQFFSNQMPISKVFNSRINRLKKIEEAYVFFGGVPPLNSNLAIELKGYKSASIEETYNQFQLNKNAYRLGVFNAANAFQLKQIVRHIFNNYIEFAEMWPTIENTGINRPLISKEPDAMAMIEEIQALKSKGIVNFSELSQLEQENILIQEAIRLSLWLNLEKHV